MSSNPHALQGRISPWSAVVKHARPLTGKNESRLLKSRNGAM
jgi:hypothetical protein